MTYASWRKEVIRLIAKGMGVDLSHARENFRGCERGPLAVVPSPRELCEMGETPAQFVANEYGVSVK